MDLNLCDTNFLIKADNIPNVLESFKKKFKNDTEVSVGEINTIEDVFLEFGYNLIRNDNDDIIDLDTVSSDLPDRQEEFFEAIASYVEYGSYIVLKREDTYLKLVFENGTVRRLGGEIVFHEKEMSYENVMGILNYCIDYACNGNKVSEVIKWLLDGGCTKEELMCLNFSKNDIEQVMENMLEEDFEGSAEE